MPSESHQARFDADGELDRVEQWPDVEGAEDLKREPTAAEIRWGITEDELRRRHLASPEPHAPNERHCFDCGHRVTETPSGREAGHADGRKAPKCPHYDGPVGVGTLDEWGQR